MHVFLQFFLQTYEYGCVGNIRSDVLEYDVQTEEKKNGGGKDPCA